MTNNPVDAEWVAPLLRAQEVLAAGPDPAATLEAIACVLLPFQPAFIDLAILHPGPDGQPSEAEIVQAWGGGRSSTIHAGASAFASTSSRGPSACSSPRPIR